MLLLWWVVASWRRGVVASWRRGVVASWRRGVVASWRRGVVASWRRGVVASWRRGVVASWRRCCCYGGSWRRGVVASWRRGVVASWRRGVVASWRAVDVGTVHQTTRRKNNCKTFLSFSVIFQSLYPIFFFSQEDIMALCTPFHVSPPRLNIDRGAKC